MVKRLAVIAVVSALMAVGVSGKPNKAADEKKESVKQSQPALLPTDSQSKQAGGQTSQAKPDTETPKWYTSFERPDWWLVGIAFFTGCVIFWQSWETRKAAQGAKENAKVALGQIQMMKDKERARLSVSEVFTPLLAFNSNWAKPDIPLKVSMYIVNDGNSFAFNVRAEGHAFIEQLIDDQTVSLSDESLDWHELEIPKTIRSPGSVRKQEIVITHKVNGPDVQFEPISEIVAKAIQKGELSLAIGGEITYEDIFAEKHKTPFFLLWVVGGDEGRGIWRAGSSWVDLSGEST